MEVKKTFHRCKFDNSNATSQELWPRFLSFMINLCQSIDTSETIGCMTILLCSRKIKFIYSENAAKFCEISILLLTVCSTVKSKVKISENFVAFSEYMNFSTPTEAYLKSHQNQRFFPWINSIKSDCIGPRVSRGTRFKFLFSFVREIWDALICT